MTKKLTLLFFIISIATAPSFYSFAKCCKRITKQLQRTTHQTTVNLVHAGSTIQDNWDKARSFVQKNTETFSSWENFANSIQFIIALPVALGIGESSGCRMIQSHGINLWCFTKSGEKKVKEAIDFLANDHVHYDQIGNPLDWVKKRATLLTWFNNEKINFAGMHFGGKLSVVILTPRFMTFSIPERAALLVHEAAHATMGPHTCGEFRDQDASKVYGTEIKYLAELAAQKKHPQEQSCVDRTILYNSARNLDSRSFCTNRTVFSQWNYEIPCIPKDPDKDGVLDYPYAQSGMEDNCPNIANPDQKDSDGDYIGDACDLCPISYDLYSWAGLDSDGDGIGDNCDDDRDGDGILNTVDNCYAISNPDQKDSDTDGTGDVCDPDIDNDRIQNDNDNCPAVYNPLQSDFDDDGVGDSCDTTVGSDIDNDGIIDKNDNCPLTYNPDQLDSNNNAIGDACEMGKGAQISIDAPAQVTQGSISDLYIKNTSQDGNTTYYQYLGGK